MTNDDFWWIRMSHTMCSFKHNHNGKLMCHIGVGKIFECKRINCPLEHKMEKTINSSKKGVLIDIPKIEVKK